jgi:hypothetical protein
MSKGEQVPEADGVADVTSVLRDVVVAAATADDGAVLEARMLEDETAREDVEAGLEEETTTGVDEATWELETDPELPHPNWMLLSCQVAVLLEKPDQTKAVTAAPLAPENELSGTLMVWEFPVRLLTV